MLLAQRTQIADKLNQLARLVRPSKTEGNPIVLERKRRILDSHSFSEAADYCACLERAPEADRIERRAFSLAAIIAYARPFSGQRDEHGNREPRSRLKLYRRVLKHDEKYLELHRHVLSLRSEYAAHYDAKRAKVELPQNGEPTQYFALCPLSARRAEDLRVLANTMESEALKREKVLAKSGKE